MLFKQYLEEYPEIYGFEGVTFNTHNLLHITNSVRRFGCVNIFSNYKFENFLQELKKHIRMPRKILQQIHNRLYEIERLNEIVREKVSGSTDLIPGNVISCRSANFGEMILKATNPDNCFAFELEGKISCLSIHRIFTEDNLQYAEGKVLKERGYLSNYTKYSLENDFVFFVNENQLSGETYQVPIKMLLFKFVKILYTEDLQLVCPMLHHLQ